MEKLSAPPLELGLDLQYAEHIIGLTRQAEETVAARFGCKPNEIDPKTPLPKGMFPEWLSTFGDVEAECGRLDRVTWGETNRDVFAAFGRDIATYRTAQGISGEAYRAYYQLGRLEGAMRRKVQEELGLKFEYDQHISDDPRVIAIRGQRSDQSATLSMRSRDERAAASSAAAHFVVPMPDRPWIEPKKVPSLVGVDISKRHVVPGGITDREVPGWGVRNFKHPSEFFNTIDQCYLPSDAYRSHFAKRGNRPMTEYADLSLWDQTDIHVFKLVGDALAPLDNNERPDWIEYIWVHWAMATKIPGLDLLVDNIRSGSHAMFAIPERTDAQQKNGEYVDARLRSKEDLFRMRDELMERVLRCGGAPPRDSDCAMEIWNIVAAVRWNIEHMGSTEYSLSELLELYSELNFLEETGYPMEYRAEYRLFSQVSAHAKVVMGGGRAEQYYKGAVFAGHTKDQCYDEVDAMFRMAVHILGEDSPRIRSVAAAWPKGREPSRYCLYNIHDAPHHRPADPPADPVGLVIAMGAQFFRMDERLRRIWRPVLGPLFELCGEKASRLLGVQAPTLVVFGTADDGEARDLDTRNADHVAGSEELAGDLQQLTLFHVEPRPIQLQTARAVVGPGSERLKQTWQEETHKYRDHRGRERTYTTAHLDVVPLPSDGALEEGEPARWELGLRAEDRLGPEHAKLIREIASNPEAGNLDRWGAVVRIAERLTGRKIDGPDIVHTILGLGQIKKSGEEAPRVSRQEADGLVFEAQFGNQAFRDLDVTSQLLTILRATSRVPKEVIVEQLVSSLAGAVSLSILRFALSVEAAIREGRTWEEDELFTFPLFTGRDEIAAAKVQFSKNPVAFRRVVVETYMKFLGILQAHHEYESSVTDWLSMLQILEDTGRPMSQCGELSHVAVEMQNWMMAGEQPQNFSAYRERFHSLPLEQWLSNIGAMDMGGTFDHIKIWSDLPVSEGEERTMVIDETAGHAMVTWESTSDGRRTNALRRGEYRFVDHAKDLDYMGRIVKSVHPDEGELIFDKRTDVPGPRLGLLADVVLAIPSLRDYALTFAPDDPVVLCTLFATSQSDAERWRILSRLLQFAPRALADNHSGQDLGHQKELLSMASLCMSKQHFGGALFLLHVREARYPTAPLLTDAKSMRELAFTRFALLPEDSFEPALAEALEGGWILPHDASELRQRRVEVERLAAEEARKRKQPLRSIFSEKALAAFLAIQELLGKLTGVLQALPDDDPLSGLGFRVSAAIADEVSKRGQEYRLEHQIEPPPDASRLLERFVDLDPRGAGFSIAMITEGLTDEEKRQMLLGAEVVILAAEKEFGYNLIPGAVDGMWASLRAAVASQRLELPYTREELIRYLPQIKAELAHSGSPAAALLAGMKKAEG